MKEESSVDSFFRSVFKFVDRQITGQTEIERLARQGNIQALETSIRLSKVLVQYKEKHCKWDRPYTHAVTSQLCTTKYIQEGDSLFRVQMMLKALHSWKYAIHEVDKVRKNPYDSNNQQHQKMLMDIWKELRPGRSIKNRKSEEWIELGFQVRDPATDFRGAGLLGLINLHRWVKKEGGKEAFKVADSPRTQYFFASASLFLTMLSLQLLKEAYITPYFWVLEGREEGKESERVLQLFQVLFQEVWWEFGVFWLEVADKTMMQFNTNLFQFSRKLKQSRALQISQRLVVRKESLLLK